MQEAFEQNEELLKKEADYQDSVVKDENIRKKQERFYHDRATKNISDFRVKLIGDIKGKTVLDLGCGKGWASLEALEAGANVIAIDISPMSIELVKKLAEEKGLADRLDARVMDAMNLELEDECIDVLVGNGILHHLPKLEQVFSEIKRVLKPDGYAVFVEPLGMNPFIKLYRKLTPKQRTEDEKPFDNIELDLIRKIFPNSEMYFFENLVLISKAFLAVGMYDFSDKMQKHLIKLDEKLLKGKSNRVTLAQKMSWEIVIKFKK